jgi:hypothetical protein
LKEGEAARKAFYGQDDATALADVNQALSKMPGDVGLNQFRALVLFAEGKYQPAAAAIHSILAVGPGWDWTTVIGLYPDEAVYTKQLRSLEDCCRTNPSQADARFLLAYQYMVCGHTQAAADQLRNVVRLVPKDEIAAQLLSLISKPAGQSKPAPAVPTAGEESPAQVDAAALSGTWTAQREGSTIQLVIKGGKFTWTYAAGGKSHKMSGTATVANNLLVLQQADGETMVGRVALLDTGGFRFTLMGGAPNDPSLSFTRGSSS